MLLLFLPLYTSCAHETSNLDTSLTHPLSLVDGEYLTHSIAANKQHLVHFNWPVNLTYLSESTDTRRVIFHLEPCEGSPLLLVRKTRPCHPDVFGCCSGPPPCATAACPWTHFTSELSGTADGAQTFMELGLGSTDYYMSIYSKIPGNYKLLALSDVGAFPRPGRNGKIEGLVNAKSELEISWYSAVFDPKNVTKVAKYKLYVKELELDYVVPSSLNGAVFLESPSKIYNTVCGMERNMVELVDMDIQCTQELCKTTVKHLKYTRKYVFNVVVQSARGYTAAYAGLLVSGAGKQIKAVTDNDVVVMIAATAGATLLCLILGYVYITKLYLRQTDDRDKGEVRR